MTISPKKIRQIKRGDLPKEGNGYYFMCLNDYYETTGWQDLRNKVYRRDESKCVYCDSPYNLQAHHMRYPESFFVGQDKHINTESDNIDKIITLCDECHSEVHPHKISVNRNVKNLTYLYEEEKPEDEIDFNMLTFPPVPDAEDDE